MSKNSTDQSRMQPSVSAPYHHVEQQPPSYEEYLKMNNNAAAAVLHNTDLGLNPYQQQQVFYQPPTFAIPGESALPYGYTHPYYSHQHQNLHYPSSSSTQSRIPQTSENVLYLAKGAKVRTTATGTISIPPPPPGCAPSPAQMAAIAGKPVIVQTKKKSFF